MKTKKETKRYKLNAVKGLTKKIYIPAKNHKKRGPPCRIFTREEIEILAKQMGLTVSEKVE